MADEQSVLVPIAVKLSKFSKKSSIRDLRRTKKNKNRKLRRKRSKLRFLNTLKELRLNRFSKDLCESVKVFDIIDMQCTKSFEETQKDVAEWQNQHQLAYWKSRAISLEYENKMLHQHIKNVYTRQIQEYLQNKNNTEYPNNSEGLEVQQEQNFEAEPIFDESSQPPKEHVGKPKQDKMTKMYGQMAPKINGMETAVQLNYDFHVDKYNPPYWPNLALNL